MKLIILLLLFSGIILFAQTNNNWLYKGQGYRVEKFEDGLTTCYIVFQVRLFGGDRVISGISCIKEGK